MSASKKLYAGEKRKGSFHHSSFLAGGATMAAGTLMAEDGKLRTVSAYSGHYRPNTENLGRFLAFLKENGINTDEVQALSPPEDDESTGSRKSVQEQSKFGKLKDPDPPKSRILRGNEKNQPSKSPTKAQTERIGSYKRTLSSNLQRQITCVPKKEMLQRIKSKKEVNSYQLGHQLPLKWSTGAGPRIGCVADYPHNLRAQALEFVDLSPRESPTPSNFNIPNDLTHHRKICNIT